MSKKVPDSNYPHLHTYNVTMMWVEGQSAPSEWRSAPQFTPLGHVIYTVPMLSTLWECDITLCDYLLKIDNSNGDKALECENDL